MSLDDFQKWYDDHYRRILSVAGKQWGYENAEEDVAKAYIRALDTANYERCDTNPLSWFLQSVKSCASNRRRAEKRNVDAQEEMYHAQNGGKRGRTAPKWNPDDRLDDRESDSFSPSTRPRPSGGQRRDWD